MNKPELVRLIAYAKRLGLAPEQALRWRVNFEPSVDRHTQRPKGMLSVGDAITKYGVSRLHLVMLRRKHGMPTTRLAKLVLIKEKTLKRWLAKFTE